MAKSIMIQGTMSNAGKSLLAAGLCRIFAQDGYRTVPFKSQNMALNSYITAEGLEMGRAQVMQAEAAGAAPSVLMNPILLKPASDVGSQVIVNGKVLGNMTARDYFAFKKQLIPHIMEAYHKLEETADLIVIEGAGSPAEINLKQDDIVNMGMAKMADAPVLLVGDIDRGGVFAQLYGTLMLLEEEERARIKGMIINKFRGDKSILDPGIAMLEEKTGLPIAGVVPYMHLSIEDEDSLSERLHQHNQDLIDFAVIRFPHISNFTDFSVFERLSGVSVRYVEHTAQLRKPDMILLPGSKNTIGDLKWMRQNGLEAVIRKFAEDGVVFGICGGYQMLGESIEDPLGLEEGEGIRGMELLPIQTVLQEEKTTAQVQGYFSGIKGIFSGLAGMEFYGYEIHMGESRQLTAGETADAGETLGYLQRAREEERISEGIYTEHVYGSYVHGIFDAPGIAEQIVAALAEKKGIRWNMEEVPDYAAFKEQQYDNLAETLRAHLDMDFIYSIINDQR